MTDLTPFIIYEDDNILAINKPAGIVVHPDGRTNEESVCTWLLSKYPGIERVGEPIELKNGEYIERPGIVHRIDRDTSGVLLIAKTAEGYECLKEQFKEREVQKVYLAFVYGNVKDDRGTLQKPIGKSPTDFRRYSAGRGAVAPKRDAITYFRVLKRGEGVTLIEAQPKTGRTHQIRVHFQEIQRPVVADKLYAASKPPMLGFKRLALHAREIRFKDINGKEHVVKADYPEDFQKAFTEIDVEIKSLP